MFSVCVAGAIFTIVLGKIKEYNPYKTSNINTTSNPNTI
jgi:hypothetical protein